MAGSTKKNPSRPAKLIISEFKDKSKLICLKNNDDEWVTISLRKSFGLRNSKLSDIKGTKEYALKRANWRKCNECVETSTEKRFTFSPRSKPRSLRRTVVKTEKTEFHSSKKWRPSSSHWRGRRILDFTKKETVQNSRDTSM